MKDVEKPGRLWVHVDGMFWPPAQPYEFTCFLLWYVVRPLVVLLPVAGMMKLMDWFLSPVFDRLFDLATGF